MVPMSHTISGCCRVKHINKNAYMQPLLLFPFIILSFRDGGKGAGKDHSPPNFLKKIIRWEIFFLSKKLKNIM
jgi:hypothetical protein